MQSRPPSGRRTAARVAAATLGLTVGAGLLGPVLPAMAEPDADSAPRRESAAAVDADTPPTLTPSAGAYLEGTVPVSSSPTVPMDSVAELAVDGTPLEATSTTGSSKLTFDVGTNSADAAFGNYLLVNDEHRIDIPTVVSERAVIEIPNDELVTGDNKIEVIVGAQEGSSCGTNYDDFALSDFRLELLEETADGESNEFNYQFGDGSCGTNTSYVLEAELHFVVSGTPGATTGLAADLDTTTLSNGRHTLSATSEAGVEVSHSIRVNNSPAGSPVITPTDGTILTGTQNLIAAVAGGVESITIDGAEPEVPQTLAPGTATFDFTVGSNSIEAVYENHLLVNGHRVEFGGDWVSQSATLEFPNRYLLPGANTIEIVTGTRNGTRDGVTCANHDDFALSGLALSAATGTVTPLDVASSYAMGDGTCGSSTTASPTATLNFTIEDAETSGAIATLDSGTARLDYLMGGNGADTGFPNKLVVNGNEMDFPAQEAGPASISIPNEWLVPGINVLDVVAGSVFSGGCDNFDDFSMTGLSLVSPSGSAEKITKMATGAGAEVPVAIGDGTCGSSFQSAHSRTQLFEIDAPAAGLRYRVDTTQLADGEHTLAATSSVGGHTATRTVIVDNSGPAIESSVPAEGQTLTSAVAFDVVLADLAGVAGEPEYLLDGAPIALGDPVGPGLEPGAHEIQVSATDAMGNTATRTIGFSSAGVPEVPTELSPAAGAGEVGPSIDLSARVATPSGGDVTAVFSEAEVVTPTSGFAGRADRMPTTLQVAGEESVDVDSLSPLTGGELESPSSTEISFQRFDVPIETADADPVLRWAGTIDPERIAALRVWDAAAEEWVVQASSRGAVETDTVLAATVDADLVDAGTLHVLITGEDPFADDLVQPDPTTNALDDPASYDFSMAHFTDTQYLAEGAAGGTYNDWDGVTEESDDMTEVERALWERAYRDTTEWLAENAVQRKISYVAHTGDITENNYNDPAVVGVVNPDTGRNELDDQVTKEFEETSKYQKVLDDAGVVNQVVAGNHDNQLGRETGPSSRFNTYYGPERYAEAQTRWAHGTYGGPWREGDNQNSYVLFSAGGLDFISIGLSYGVTRAEANWADDLLEQYADRNAILLTHDYLAPSTSPDGRGGGLMGDGSVMYKLLVEENPNVFLVLAGHRHGVATNLKRGVGITQTNGVVEMLADYQAYTVSAGELGLAGDLDGDGDIDHEADERLRFGASFLRLLQFDVDAGTMSVDTYSPHLDDMGATEYDISGTQTPRYDGSEDAMVIPVDLSSRTTSFTTSSLAAYVAGDELGRDTVASGERATLTWDELEPATAYGWMVTALSPGGGRAVSEPGHFSTMDAVVPTVSSEAVSAVYGEDIEVTVTVDAGEYDATGAVTLSDGDTELASGDLTDGAVTLTVPAGLEPGTYELTAAYAGAGFVAAAENTVMVTVTEADAPVATTAPSVEGEAVLGETLSVEPGVWDVEGLTFAYQWLRDGAPIEGATTETYQVTEADLGTSLSVAVTASTTGRADGMAVAPAVVVEPGPAPQASTAPSVVGTPILGETLTVDTGAWDVEGLTFGYQWLRNGKPIRTATFDTYQVSAADLGARLSVEVSATRAGYEDGAATTAAVRVAKAASTVSAKVAKSVVKQGRKVKVLVSVRAKGVIPTGTVRILDGKRKVGAKTLTRGTTRITVRKLKPGTHRLVAVYRGDGSVKGSRSKAVTVKVVRRR